MGTFPPRLFIWSLGSEIPTNISNPQLILLPITPQQSHRVDGRFKIIGLKFL
jgi:hypothetical protein